VRHTERRRAQRGGTTERSVRGGGRPPARRPQRPRAPA